MFTINTHIYFVDGVNMTMILYVIENKGLFYTRYLLNYFFYIKYSLSLVVFVFNTQ